jgi:hypothetical protein
MDEMGHMELKMTHEHETKHETVSSSFTVPAGSVDVCQDSNGGG